MSKHPKQQISSTGRSAGYDYRLAVGYGSAWHLLRCLGWQRARFTSKIAAEVGATEITWLDFPGYGGEKCYPHCVPIRDGEWKRIDFMSDSKVKAGYAWPERGEQQNWDAVGKAIIGGTQEWLLVEAKAHPGEIKSTGTEASEAGGRPVIRAAFKRTLQALGYTEEVASTRAEEWLRGHYQHANRLAALQLLTELGIAAHIIFLYFCGDKHPDGKFCPAIPEEWEPTLNNIRSSLGLTGASKLEKRVHNVFVDVSLATTLPSASQGATRSSMTTKVCNASPP